MKCCQVKTDHYAVPHKCLRDVERTPENLCKLGELVEECRWPTRLVSEDNECLDDARVVDGYVL